MAEKYRDITVDFSPDFAYLASKYVSFGTLVTQEEGKHLKINFQDPEVLRELTRVTLLEYFQLEVEVPKDYLCPTIPNRFKYVQIIHSLLFSSPERERNPSSPVLDIGTGSLAVYLLLAQSVFHLSGIGVDTNQEALELAREMIARNKLEAEIRLHSVSESALLQSFLTTFLSELDDARKHEVIQELLEREGQSWWKLNGPILNALVACSSFYSSEIDTLKEVRIFGVGAKKAASKEAEEDGHEEVEWIAATMCNPPFYDEREEVKKTSLKLIHRFDFSFLFPTLDRCEQSFTEHGLRGGAANLWRRSCLRARHDPRLTATAAQVTPNSYCGWIEVWNGPLYEMYIRVRWYSSLLGKKSSLKFLLKVLAFKGLVLNIRTFRVEHGRTMRWVLAWSFQFALGPIQEKVLSKLKPT